MKSLVVTALIIRLNQNLILHWREDGEKKKIIILNFAFFSKYFVTEKKCSILLFRCYDSEANFALVFKKIVKKRELSPFSSLGCSIS